MCIHIYQYIRVAVCNIQSMTGVEIVDWWISSELKGVSLSDG